MIPWHPNIFKSNFDELIMTYENLDDFNKYYTIQIWSGDDQSGESLSPLVKKIKKELKLKNNATIVSTEGPTCYLPDFFSELYGKYRGYLIAVKKTVDPYDLKRTCIELENDSSKERVCDIDVYTSMRDSIHRRDLK